MPVDQGVGSGMSSWRYRCFKTRHKFSKGGKSQVDGMSLVEKRCILLEEKRRDNR